MRRCPTCSAELTESSRFCSSCGRSTSLASKRSPAENIETQALGEIASSGASSAIQASTRRAEEGRFLGGEILAARYRIVGMLGRGGMGEVYRAADLKLGQQVALKFLPESLLADESALARFLNEVRMARQVSHPNVCRVFDIGDVEGQPCISMEYVDGEDLGSLLRRIGRVPHDKAIEMARKLCAGLAAAHDKGVLHRDLKPANIMIDGRGELLIMDFGLAAAAADIRGNEVAYGTPAYMAPEQLAGKEVSVRSDLYSLGLVLYEMFTGRRAFEAGTLAELISLRESSAPVSLHSIVGQLDPAVERAVLRCLDPDPSLRPSSALSVAAALPGGDPLAAALAAGETPSPEMVAGASSKEAWHPRAALACLAFIAAALAVLPFLAKQTTWITRAHLDRPPEVLAQKARDIAQSLGYTGPIQDSALGFEYFGDYVHFLNANPNTEFEMQSAAAQPAPILFWYRSSPRYLTAENYWDVGDVDLDDPALAVSGMIRMELDPQGRLVRFEAVPKQLDPTNGPPQQADWPGLFQAAGLDFKDFDRTDPQWNSLVPSDARAAWNSSCAVGEIRVEAASWHGKPVFFRIVWPWTKPERDDPSHTAPRRQLAGVIGSILLVVVLVWACVLARQNVRANRGDRRGAMHLASFVFLVTMAGWAARAHHVPRIQELLSIGLGLSYALLIAALVWLLYVALEPFVRRRWPQTMIAWSRALAGRWRDAVVGSHVLAGIAGGLLTVLCLHASQVFKMRAGSPPASFLLPDSLGGWLQSVNLTLASLPNLVLEALGLFFVLFLMRSLLRGQWAAAGAFVLLFASLTSLATTYYVWLSLPFRIIQYSLAVFLLMQFGLLSMVVADIVTGLLINLPIIADWSAWYSGSGIGALIAVAVLSAVAFQIALGGRRLLRSDLFET